MSNTSKRPGAVMAAAVMMFIFGGYTIVGGLVNGASTVTSMVGGAQPGAKAQKVDPNDFFAMQKLASAEVPSYVPTELAVNIIGLLLGSVKIFAALGLLKMKPSARTLAIWAALCSILVDISHSVYAILFVLPVANRLFEAQGQNLPPGVDFAGIMKIFMIGIIIFAMVFNCIIWTVVIYLLNTQKVRDAFAGKFPETEPAPVDERIKQYDGYEDDAGASAPMPKSPGDTGITNRPA